MDKSSREYEVCLCRHVKSCLLYTSVGVGVAISSKEPVKKRVSEYTAIVYLGNVDESSKMIDVSPNTDIF